MSRKQSMVLELQGLKKSMINETFTEKYTYRTLIPDADSLVALSSRWAEEEEEARMDCRHCPRGTHSCREDHSWVSAGDTVANVYGRR